MEDARPASRLLRLLPYLLGLLTGMVIGLGALLYLLGSGKFGTGVAPAPVDLLASRRNAIVTAVENTRGSVVTIRAGGLRDLTDRMPAVPGVRFFAPLEWVGSGLLIDRDGYIVTNEHVVRGANDIVVGVGDRDSGGRSMRAKLVGSAPSFDLALLQVDAKFDSNVTRLGDSDRLLVGEWAIAIGSPFGYDMDNPDPSVSVGVISAVGQDLRTPQGRQPGDWPYQRMIQTDAAINDGNSGGPLVTSDGAVVGINTAKLSDPGGGSVGVNFSIPINTVKWVWQELRRYGEVRRPWIGLVVQEVAPAVRKQLDVPEEEGFLTVAQVTVDSPAARAGLQPGDIIHTINGLDPYSAARANHILFGTRVGSVVDVEVLHDGKMRHALVDVVEDPRAQAERLARTGGRVG